MKYLRERKLDAIIKSLTQPVLGICLGQQLMCTYSEEADTICMGIFDTRVKKFPPANLVPHTGWNNSEDVSGSLFTGISTEDNFYYVHSYYSELCKDTTAICKYILPFSAALQKDNFYATQFHPEKSAGAGERLLNNFLTQ